MRLAALFVALAATGCASLPEPATPEEWPLRRAALLALDDWELEGRVAVAAGEEGFSGGLNWQQSGARAVIRLRGPVGGAGMRIEVDGAQYSVMDERGNSYRGADARRYVEERLGAGATLPVEELRYWLLGAPAPGTPHEETIGAGGRLERLTQSGWEILYERYADAGSQALPARIELSTEGLRLRVVVSDWRAGA
jgi:outer membrane lipoprotein LolB